VPLLALHRQHYYSWLACPITDAEWVEAHRANAIFDAHRDDPEFGYRFLLGEARDAGQDMSERTAWRVCSDNGWWSRFGKKKRYANARVGAPAHDDVVRREFTAPETNMVWLSDLTEHPTQEGKFYLCAIKDVWSRRIVGYSISDRMTSQIAVTALESAVARRAAGPHVAGCVPPTDEGRNFGQDPPMGRARVSGHTASRLGVPDHLTVPIRRRRLDCGHLPAEGGGIHDDRYRRRCRLTTALDHHDHAVEENAVEPVT
jgi:transposase InsO family protein